MSELRDVEAIRADLAVLAEQPRTGQGARAMGDLAADVEPLLSALAAEKARADSTEQRPSVRAWNELAEARARAEQQLRQVREQVADRDANLAALREENDLLRNDRDAAISDALRFRPIWSSPYSRPERWTTEPIPFPRRYVSTHDAMEDYAGSIRCASDWPVAARHAALERALRRVPDLCYEITHLQADLAALSSVPTSPTQTDAELGNEAIRQTAREVALRAVIEDAWGWIMAGRPDEAERQLNDALQSFRPTNRAEKD